MGESTTAYPHGFRPGSDDVRVGMRGVTLAGSHEAHDVQWATCSLHAGWVVHYDKPETYHPNAGAMIGHYETTLADLVRLHPHIAEQLIAAHREVMGRAGLAIERARHRLQRRADELAVVPGFETANETMPATSAPGGRIGTKGYWQ